MKLDMMLDMTIRYEKNLDLKDMKKLDMHET